ncbi:hypothetical protein RB195_002936 [Necator americanus]|uniref:Uncharacterized protein n=1 Tax=Necator americanus TaxID=51031 RepID=A0ABR1DLD3_NECAM
MSSRTSLMMTYVRRFVSMGTFEQSSTLYKSTWDRSWQQLSPSRREFIPTALPNLPVLANCQLPDIQVLRRSLSWTDSSLA